MESTKPTKSRHEYSVAWVAALSIERASAIAMLDEEHGRPHNFRQPSTDPNSYTWGSVAQNNVVIVSLASGVYGNVMAAVTISELLGSFPNIKFGLLVGIGAGVPRSDYDVRLGDIVVSYPIGTSSGVIQYDLGKAKAGGAWERKDSFNRPPELLLKAISALQASRDLSPFRNTELVQEATSRHSHWGKTYIDTDTLPDKLFKIAYHHPVDAKDCSNCEPEFEIKRGDRDSKEPAIHYGVVASGNSLVKDAETREKIAALDPNCICLEMEAAGLMNSLPCLVIRGICDYADTHKNDSWQRLASARAAAYAKELLGYTAPVHHDGQEITTVRSRVVSSARRHGRIKQTRGQGKIKEQMVPLLPLLHKCPYAERKNRNIKRVAGTCEWFTNHNRFKDWYNQSTSSLLWVSADPGCGKSVLARYLIDELFPASDRIVCYFFFKDDSSEQRNASIAICSLLHQILEQDRELLKHPAVKRLLTSRSNFDDAFVDLWKTLMAVVADQKTIGEMVFVLDALDECSDSDRKALIEAIGQVDFEGPSRARFKLLLTSRPYDHIQRGFQILKSRMPVIHLSGEGPEEIAQISEEIGLVIKHTVQQISQEKQLTTEEHDFLLEHLTSVENRTYLWVHLTIEIIRKNPGFNKGDVRRAITELPSSVDEAYERILSRCSDVDKARKIFASILAAEEALTVVDISTILAVGDDEGKVTEDIGANIEPADRMAIAIRDLCGLFVVVKDFEVHLLHQTAREFLINKGLSNEQIQQARTPDIRPSDVGTATWKHSFELAKCHRFLTSVCVRFLQMDAEHKGIYDFESYAATYWEDHMRDALLEKADKLIAMGLELCNNKMRSSWLYGRKPGGDPSNDDNDDNSGKEKGSKTTVTNGKLADPRLSPTLVLVAWIGVEPLLQAALDQCPNVNITDGQGTTALWWAAAQDYHDIAKILLVRGAKVQGNTLYPDLKPLHKASASGSLDTVKLLLAHGAKVNVRNIKGYQPLHYAAGYGYKDIVNVLLDAGAEINSRDNSGSTPLKSAAGWGHSDVVQVLLRRGAEVDSANKLGYTPLVTAIAEQHMPVVDALLEAGADINLEAKNGYTPLAVAAMDNLIPFAKHLIQCGAKIDRGGIGGNPLCQAVYYGYLEMVEQLVSYGADVNWTNKKGESVSSWLDEIAVSSVELQAIIEVLVGHGAKMDAADENGMTVLLNCCLRKQTRLAKILCRFQASIDDVIGFPSETLRSTFEYDSFRGWTALHAAAFMADTALTRYLLARGAAINKADAYKHTPLFWAVIGCVDNVIFRTKDENQLARAPFFWTSLGIKGLPKMIMPRRAAAWNDARAEVLEELYPEGHETAQFETVKLLLENGANPHLKGVNWRYSLLPGLRKFRKQRKALFVLLKEYQDKPPSELPARNLLNRTEENGGVWIYEIASLDGDSARNSYESIGPDHTPHVLENIAEDENEHKGDDDDDKDDEHEEGSEDEEVEADRWEEESEVEVIESEMKEKNNHPLKVNDTAKDQQQ